MGPWNSNDQVSQYFVPAPLERRLNAWLSVQGFHWEGDWLEVEGAEQGNQRGVAVMGGVPGRGEDGAPSAGAASLARAARLGPHPVAPIPRQADLRSVDPARQARAVVTTTRRGSRPNADAEALRAIRPEIT